MMINHIADGVNSARSDAWIGTVLIHAGSSWATVGIGDAFWVGAGRLSVNDSAVTVGAAWIGQARVNRLWWTLALVEWITNHILGAAADWAVVVHVADGLIAANAWARINALQVGASLVLRAVRVD